MSTIMVKAGQSLIDIAIQDSGSIAAVIDLAMKNGLSITDTLTAGTAIESVGIYDKKNATLFGNLIHKPATALNRFEIRDLCDEVADNPLDFGTFDFTFDDSFYK